MKVKFTYGPRAGETQHMSVLEARPLITAGMAEEVPCTGSTIDQTREWLNERIAASGRPDVAPKWTVLLMRFFKSNLEGKAVEAQTATIRMTVGKHTTDYFGKPEDVNDTVPSGSGVRYLSGFGRPCPDEIVKQYTALWKKKEYRAEMIPQAQGDGVSNETMANHLKDANRLLKEGLVARPSAEGGFVLDLDENHHFITRPK